MWLFYVGLLLLVSKLLDFGPLADLSWAELRRQVASVAAALRAFWVAGCASAMLPVWR